MKKNKLFRYILPMIVILFASSVLITWLITYRVTMGGIDKKYEEMLAGFTADSELSRTVYSVDATLKGAYLGNVDDEQMTSTIIRGYVEGLNDAYASYFTAEDYDEFKLYQTEGIRVGVGIRGVKYKDGEGIYITHVYSGSAAENAGIREDDVLLAVDGNKVRDIGVYGALMKIASGDADTVLTLQIHNSTGKVRDVTLARQQLAYPTVLYQKLQDNIGVLTFTEFTSTTVDDFKNAIQSLTVMGVEKFIFDVRHNAGGDMDSVCKTLDFLLPEGKITTVTTKDGTQTDRMSDELNFTSQSVVLIDGYTCGEAELFAGCLRYYQKTPIYGVQSYGKGSLQSFVELPNSRGDVYLTTSTFSLPDGSPIDGVGITPDEIVEQTSSSPLYLISPENDTPMQKAVAYLKALEDTKMY